MLATTFSACAPIHQCPRCGWPVEGLPEPVVFFPPAIIHHRTIRRIAESVAYARGDVTAAEIMDTRGGERRITDARAEVIWLARQIKNPDLTHRFSLTQIARQFSAADGGLHHTTILSALRAHEAKQRKALLEAIRLDNAASAEVHRVAA